MRSNISRRLKQLEQKARIHEAHPVIFVSFVSPGQPHQSSRAECDDQAWERIPRETEEDFEQRVVENLRRHKDRPTVVIFHPELAR
jgi:hypothetical protein